MSRYIDADKLLYDEITDKHGDTYLVVHAPEIDNAPTEDVQPVVHAHWKEISRVRHIGKCNLPISRCSCCNFEFCDIINTNELYNFCPYCGAKMDKKEATYIKDIFMTR